MAERISLRWRFTYATRPDRFGSWDCASRAPEHIAALQPKDGLVRAFIEGRSATGEVFPVLHVDGPDYVFCQGEAWTSLRPGSKTSVIGLSFLTRDEKLTAYIDGQVKRRYLTARERQFKFCEHTAGA